MYGSNTFVDTPMHLLTSDAAFRMKRTRAMRLGRADSSVFQTKDGPSALKRGHVSHFSRVLNQREVPTLVKSICPDGFQPVVFYLLSSFSSNL